MQLDPARFNRLLKDMGQRCLWRRAHLCPCRDAFSGAANPACPNCHGVGTFWEAPIAAWTGLTGMRTAREWAGFGMWESGDEVLSVPSDSPLYEAGENDQVVMINSEDPYTATFERGAADERLPPYMVRIEAVHTLEEGAIAPRAIPKLADMAAGGSPIWPMGDAPEEGQQYSLRGKRRPVFFVFKNLPQDRAHHSGRTLPRRIAARRFDLFGR